MTESWIQPKQGHFILKTDTNLYEVIVAEYQGTSWNDEVSFLVKTGKLDATVLNDTNTKNELISRYKDKYKEVPSEELLLLFLFEEEIVSIDVDYDFFDTKEELDKLLYEKGVDENYYDKLPRSEIIDQWIEKEQGKFIRKNGEANFDVIFVQHFGEFKWGKNINPAHYSVLVFKTETFNEYTHEISLIYDFVMEHSRNPKDDIEAVFWEATLHGASGSDERYESETLDEINVILKEKYNFTNDVVEVDWIS